MKATVYILICFVITSSCESYKALVVFPMPSRSHSMLGEGVVKQLLKDGYEVTYIRTFEYKNPPPNLRQIDVSSNFNELPINDSINIKFILEKKSIVNDFNIVRTRMNKVVRKTVENENVQKLLNDPKENFDVVIVEWMFTDVISGFAPLFNCPLIWMSPVEINSGIISLIDEAPSPAYTTNALSMKMSPFTFYQRVEELWTRIKLAYNGYMYHDKEEKEIYDRLIAPLIAKRGRVPPPFDEVRYNASLILGNSHVSMGQAVTLPQSYKPIGGYHIDEENVKPLPADLEKIMLSAKNGVIYFSMGSNLKSKDWPEEIKRSLLKMFGGLKQTVLWKFEEDLPDVPENVHILKWAPQHSILAHPKCVLFITHGGLLSTIETIHFGVPIIGIPVFGDQFMNTKRAVSKGFALQVDLSYSTAEDLKVAIEEMIHNPSYRQKVKELSFVYHDRIAKPSAELSHWVQHVMRTRGAPHLRSPALQVPLYQRLYLDLAALLAAIGIIIGSVLLLLLRILCKKFCSKTKVDGKKKKKN